MIIVNLKGGLGNQMFQYAVGRYLATKHRTELKMDLVELLDRSPKPKGHVYRDYDLHIFQIKEAFATPAEVRALRTRIPIPVIEKFLNKVIGNKKSYLVEGPQHFHPNIFNAPDNVYLDGYWQSPKYFAPVAAQLKKEFTVKEPLSPMAGELLQRLQNTHSVCVNIRRGDFVTNPVHGTCNPEYYKKAEEIIRKKTPDIHFYVFSDEIDWCRENLRFSAPATFVTHDYAGKKFQDYFRLMSGCKDFIIPNSSFAWWAAYLSDSQHKTVIAPEKWLHLPGFNLDDLLPKDWIRI